MSATWRACGGRGRRDPYLAEDGADLVAADYAGLAPARDALIARVPVRGWIRATQDNSSSR